MMQATYHLVTTSVEAYLGGALTLPFNEMVYHSRAKVHFLFLGMGSIASTAAISNVVTVEPFGSLGQDKHRVESLQPGKLHMRGLCINPVPHLDI